MIQPEIAESTEIAESAEIVENAEITERTEDSSAENFKIRSILHHSLQHYFYGVIGGKAMINLRQALYSGSAFGGK
ncbi:hypothetical protein Tco_1171389 [Tanacetum coccineum]